LKIFGKGKREKAWFHKILLEDFCPPPLLKEAKINLLEVVVVGK
jgi:hypothetical protein